MKIMEYILMHSRKDITFHNLAKVIGVLTVILLFKLTGNIWMVIWSTTWSIIRPFIFGFVIAFVLQPLIQWAELKRISKKLSIPIVYIMILLLFIWLIFSMVPIVFVRLSNFIPSLATGINAFYDILKENVNSDIPIWLQGLVESVTNSLNDYTGILPSLSANITTAINNTLSFLSDGIFTIVISIYISFSWDSICKRILEIAHYIHKDYDEYLIAISEDIGTYVRSLLVLMLIKFAEYALLYFMVGYSNWLIIALLTAIGLLVPYVGATLANIIGIITAFTLPIPNIIFLIVMIGVLSNIDAYLIAPFVHSKNINISPIWGIFCIYAGSILAGIGGIIIAIPVYLAIRTIIEMKQSNL